MARLCQTKKWSNQNSGVISPYEAQPTMINEYWLARRGMRVVVGKRNRRHHKVPPVSLGDGFEKAFQFAAASRVTQFAQGFGFDLADAFACHAVLFANFFQCPRVTVRQAIA